MHSDRAFRGGPVALGPYGLSAVIRGDGEYGPAIILQGAVHTHLMPELVIDGKLAPADSTAYHGGTSSDEIVALVALECGVRLRVAGTRRLSGIHDGSARPPIFLDVPPLARPGRSDREVLPWAKSRGTNLDALRRLPHFPQISENAQVELVRAARSYAAGLWWANEDPSQAWLHLVTAVETAAKFRQVVNAQPIELVRELWPEMWQALEGADDGVREAVAARLATQMKSTRAFVDFVGDLAPGPPHPRPEWDDLDWSKMRSHARKVYDHRSKALHSGKPFPLPMLEVPRLDASGTPQEAPWGLTSGGGGAIWEKDETPMLLSTFEYIAREALLRWWDELIP